MECKLSVGKVIAELRGAITFRERHNIMNNLWYWERPAALSYGDSILRNYHGMIILDMAGVDVFLTSEGYINILPDEKDFQEYYCNEVNCINDTVVNIYYLTGGYRIQVLKFEELIFNILIEGTTNIIWVNIEPSLPFNPYDWNENDLSEMGIELDPTVLGPRFKVMDVATFDVTNLLRKVLDNTKNIDV